VKKKVVQLYLDILMMNYQLLKNVIIDVKHVEVVKLIITVKYVLININLYINGQIVQVLLKNQTIDQAELMMMI